MNQHRYILEKYRGSSTRYQCPKCQKREKTFSLYIDTETGEALNPNVGRCNRESNCGYHYTPKQYFEDNRIHKELLKPKSLKAQPSKVEKKPFSQIPVSLFVASQRDYQGNNFIKFLIDLFGTVITINLIEQYFISSSKHWNGATVFWQIDITGKIRTGKIMLYNPDTGKRVKEPFNHINWVHKVIKEPDFELKQCMFGEHLLKDKSKQVAIVESEKTAIIASVYLPQFIWLAVGSLQSLNAEKCEVLKGRTVFLFPDLNGYDKWQLKAKELSHLGTFKVSGLLESKATEAERANGFDLADYLIRFNYKDFITTKKEVVEPEKVERPVIEEEPITYLNYTTTLETNKTEYPEPNITELENFFSTTPIPNYPVRLNESSTIIDCRLFIESHLTIAKANLHKPTFAPYLHRLQTLRQIITSTL